MARYQGPVCRLCRREGQALFLKGQRCYTAKCPFLAPKKDPRQTLPLPPGKLPKFRRRPREYGLQLREKQKARRIYVVLEKQFKGYFQKAETLKGVTGELLFTQLERRLDNVVYRLGFASSRRQAREMVVHRHFLVNHKPVDIPSYQVKEGDVVEIKAESRTKPFVETVRTITSARPLPTWLERDSDQGRGTIISLPRREHVQEQIDEQLIVNFYSR
jgi:small subunit ribosomal protein S4